jgi:outer membrane protein assembly factor BamB
VFVTGSTLTPPGTNGKYLTIAYDAATGTRLWQARYFAGTSGPAAASSVAVSPDSSKVFVTGAASNGLNAGGATTIGYDAATGTRLWVARYPNPAGATSNGRTVMVSPDGSKVFIAAVVGPNCCSRQDFAVAGYDAATGAQLWTASYGTAGQFDPLASAALSRNGARLFLTGTGDLFGAPEFLTVAFHA